MSLSEGSVSCDAEIKEAALGALFKAANESAVAAIKAGSTSPTATLEHLSGKAAQMRGTLGADLLSDGRHLSVEAIKKAASETYTNVPEALCDKDTPVPVCNTLKMLDSLLSCIEEDMERNRYPFHNATLPRDILSPERSTCTREDDKETNLKAMTVEQDQIMDGWVRSCDQPSGGAACTREDDKETNLKAMTVEQDQIMDGWVRSCDQSSGGAACTREDDKETNLEAMIVALDQIMDDWVRSLGSPQNAQLNTAVVKLGTDHRCESPYNPLATTDGYEGVRMFENSKMRQISDQVMEPAINSESIFWRLFGSRIKDVFRSIKGRFHSIPVGLKSSDDLIKLHTCHAYASTVFQLVSDNCRECEVPLSNRNSSRLSSACPLVTGAAAMEKINHRSREIPSPEHIYEECRPKWDNHAPTMNDSVYELVGPSDPTLKADTKLL